jgi:hypothetical protein
MNDESFKHMVLVKSQNHNYLELQDREGNVFEPVYNMVLYTLALEGKKFTRRNYWRCWLEEPSEDPNDPPAAAEIVEEVMEESKLALPFLIDETKVQ